ncbi:hypothetical protein C3K47_03130 [Solitalea longa]|uniref:DinB-like domain-containing protein n=1 Tax=Solitalea longa TaxID=2079460 RepID=A0A2S5A827_9SPHI|nr:DinB family protein [Solitalea longa]POY38407.1 hypothetical protein C3K47_03130 [Solitalea longa]
MKAKLAIRKTLALMCIAFAMPVFSLAQELSKQEKDYALQLLQTTKEKFLFQIEDLTPEQWNYKTDSLHWSIAECSEHIAISEKTLLSLVNKLMADPANSAMRAEMKYKTEDLVKMVQNRSVKAKAPEMLKPTHRWKNEEDLMAEFETDRQKTIDFMKLANNEVNTHLMQHPVFGYLDAYQWVVLLAAHSSRHTAQIMEIKSSKGYPKL